MSGITSRHHFRGAQAMRSFRHNRSGNVLAVFGLSLPVVLTAAGAALDYSDLTRKRSELQKVADETALSAAKALATSAASSSSQRENEARELADRLLKRPRPTRSGRSPHRRRRAGFASTSSTSIHSGSASSSAPKSSLAIQSEATYSAAASACIIALGQTEDAGISLVGSAKM